jgi:hypothetical protein
MVRWSLSGRCYAGPSFRYGAMVSKPLLVRLPEGGQLSGVWLSHAERGGGFERNVMDRRGAQIRETLAIT